MSGTREISGRIRGIRDTKKITNAMYLISSTKLKKARDGLEGTEPYFHTLESMIARIIRHAPDIRHPYLDDGSSPLSHSEKTQAYIVITADKGMAGAYNHNVLKLAREQLESNENWQLFVVGEVGRQYFTARGIHIDKSFLYTAQNPSLHRARSIAGEMLDLFDRGEIDDVYIVYTRMKNSMTMETQFTRLLPLNKDDFLHLPEDDRQSLDQVSLLPSPEVALDHIIPNYLTGFLYGALVESFCCEQNARMLAMSAANDNADQMIHDLSIQYNRVRQAAITQEITEVVSGAQALQSSPSSALGGERIS